jgi:hypothetical protein
MMQQLNRPEERSMKDRKCEMTELFIDELGEVSGGAGSFKIPIATTRALGEEGGPVCPPDVTTLALGEEGGGGPGPIFTTNALGEEGGSPLPPVFD